ncbi:DUF2335 domain-containing protein [Actinobaculum massiliense]|uniref:DUF2335 domain-containing protein n=1 Tax=Actinobaculum massiliense TaxID=202789 RepID=UPI0009EC5574|nr:DUF2335 domain-containing protein [Actinobaculum massiliense]
MSDDDEQRGGVSQGGPARGADCNESDGEFDTKEESCETKEGGYSSEFDGSGVGGYGCGDADGVGRELEEVIAGLPPHIAEALKDATARLEPEEKRIVEQVALFHSGPLPAPDQLAGYGNVLPGSPDRILRMAEASQDARIRNLDAHSRSIDGVTEDNHRLARAEAFGMRVITLGFTLLPLLFIIALLLGAYISNTVVLWVGAIGTIASAFPGVMSAIRGRSPNSDSSRPSSHGN